MFYKFSQNPTLDCLIRAYGEDRVLEAKDNFSKGLHVELCWFFIADYCRSMYISPFNPDTYNRTKEIFMEIIK